MAGKATHGAFLEARRFEQTVIFSAGDADHAIGPVAVLDEGWIALQSIFEPLFIRVLQGAHDGQVRFQIIAWAITETFVTPVVAGSDPLDAVALTANLRRSFVIELRG